MQDQPASHVEPSPPHLSVVIPAYNEGLRLEPSLQQIRDYAQATGESVEVLIVDDGSTDKTAAVATAFEPGPLIVRVLRNDTNQGKGYSVRRGMLEARGHLVLMSDADLSTPIGEIDKLICWIDQGYDVVIGSRDMKDSVLEPPQPWYRRLMGRIFRNIRKQILLPQLRDTQCGFKCFTRQAAQQVFELLQTTGFAFDCEALAIAAALGYQIKEAGVVWRNNDDSRVRPIRDSWRMIRELLRIRKRLKLSLPQAVDTKQNHPGIARPSHPVATARTGQR